jgi:hypothetical protein
MLRQVADLPALQEVFRKTCSLLKVKLGLEVNVSKTELVSNNTDDLITDESGEVIMAINHGKYLGQLIDADGNTMTTINNSFFGKIIRILMEKIPYEVLEHRIIQYVYEVEVQPIDSCNNNFKR